MDPAGKVNYRTIAIRLLTLSGVLLALYLLFKFLLPFYFPFVIAIIVAVINEPVTKLLSTRLRIPRKIASFISLLLTIIVFGLIITLGFFKIYRELADLQDKLSNYLKSVSANMNLVDYIKHLTANFNSSGQIEGAPKALNNFLGWVSDYYKDLPDSIANAIDSTMKGLLPYTQRLVKSLVSGIIDTITSIPRLTIYLIVTILSTYFISSDRKLISDFIRKQLTKRDSERFSTIKKDILFDLVSYTKSILLLISVTFLVVFFGLLILKVDYKLLISLLVSVCEVIPFLGAGIIMVPWIIWNIISGSYLMALGLGILYVLTAVFKHIIKPKVVRTRVGIHPLLTLLSMALGLGVFGISGLVLGPVCMVILKNLQASGIITIWNEPDKNKL